MRLLLTLGAGLEGSEKYNVELIKIFDITYGRNRESNPVHKSGIITGCLDLVVVQKKSCSGIPRELSNLASHSSSKCDSARKNG